MRVGAGQLVFEGVEDAVYDSYAMAAGASSPRGVGRAADSAAETIASVDALAGFVAGASVLFDGIGAGALGFSSALKSSQLIMCFLLEPTPY